MRFFFILVVICLITFSCGSPDVPPQQILTGPRLVSLSPNLTDLLCAMGAGDSIVGICAPRGASKISKSTPIVASYGFLDIERVVSLKPTACLSVYGMHPAGQMADLRRLGVETFEYHLDNLEELWSCIRDLGVRAGVKVEAQRLAESCKSRVENARKKVGVLPPVSGALLVGCNPLVVAGSGTCLDRIMDAAGIRNVFGGAYSSYPAISEEELLSRQPGYLIFPDGDIAGADVERLAALVGGGEKKAAVIPVPADILSRPGTGTPEAVETMVRLRLEQETSGRGSR